MITQEQYHGVPIAVNGTYNTQTQGEGIGGFIAVTAGTITVARVNPASTATPPATTPVLTAFPVSAGTVYGFPIIMAYGYVVTLAGGASGTLLTV